MPVDLSNQLVIGVSSRALFSLEEENSIFEKQGVAVYSRHQIEREDIVLRPGVAFPLVKAVQQLNESLPDQHKIVVILMSRNSVDTGLRALNSAEKHQLSIARAAFTSGASLAPYLKPFKVDLFLSAHAPDVQMAVNAGIAAALIYNASTDYQSTADQIRIAFDGDAVLFSDQAERVFQADGLPAFLEHEKRKAREPLPAGPFAKLLQTISFIQSQFDQERSPIRTALVTARNSPAHERVIRTLRQWNVRIDEAFFMGGVDKTEVLEAFRPHMFFDDQESHLRRAAPHVPSAQVPWVTRDQAPASAAPQAGTTSNLRREGDR